MVTERLLRPTVAVRLRSGCRWLRGAPLLSVWLLCTTHQIGASAPPTSDDVVCGTSAWLGQCHTWLPDGRVVHEARTPGWHVDLRLLDRHTGRDWPACKPRSAWASVLGPEVATVSVSPNARRVVIVGTTALITCDADGGRPTLWRTGPYRPYWVLWAPNSRQFATLEVHGRTYSLVFRPGRGRGWTTVATRLPKDATSFGSTRLGFAIGPDTIGTPPGWKQPEHVRALLWEWRRRGAVRAPAVDIKRPAPGSIWGCEISPDGRRILYKVSRDADRRQGTEGKWPDLGTALYVSNLDGSRLRALSTWAPLRDGRAHLYATWLPDSRRVSVAADGKLVIVNAGRE